MLGIIDYGSGNVSAIANILKQKKIPHFLSGDPDQLSAADRFILPGVGAFDPTMKHLQESGIIDFLNEEVLVKKKRVLGICVGMHILAEGSDEGELSGLGWIPGRVRRIDTRSLDSKPHLPHMGWNSIKMLGHSGVLKSIDADQGFYFLHSYFFDAADPSHVTATVRYGEELPCAVEKGNVMGAQFHPEKSHANGVQLLLNFAGLS